MLRSISAGPSEARSESGSVSELMTKNITAATRLDRISATPKPGMP